MNSDLIQFKKLFEFNKFEYEFQIKNKMKCKNCYSNYDVVAYKPMICIPCRDMFCISCLKEQDKCYECGSKINLLKKDVDWLENLKEINLLKGSFELSYEKKMKENQTNYELAEKQLVADTNKKVDEILHLHHEQIRKLKEEQERLRKKCDNIRESKQAIELEMSDINTEKVQNLKKLLEKKIEEINSFEFKYEEIESKLNGNNSKKRKHNELEISNLGQAKENQCANQISFQLNQIPVFQTENDRTVYSGMLYSNRTLISNQRRQSFPKIHKIINIPNNQRNNQQINFVLAQNSSHQNNG